MLMRCCKIDFSLHLKLTIGARIYDRHLSVTSATKQQGSGASSRDDKDKHQNRKFLPRTGVFVARRDKTSSNNGTFFEELPGVTKIYGFSWLVLKGAIWMKYFLLLHIAVADSGHESCDSKILALQRNVLRAVAPWLRQVTLSMVGEGLEADKNTILISFIGRTNCSRHSDMGDCSFRVIPGSDGRFGVYFKWN